MGFARCLHRAINSCGHVTVLRDIPFPWDLAAKTANSIDTGYDYEELLYDNLFQPFKSDNKMVTMYWTGKKDERNSRAPMVNDNHERFGNNKGHAQTHLDSTCGS